MMAFADTPAARSFSAMSVAFRGGTSLSSAPWKNRNGDEVGETYAIGDTLLYSSGLSSKVAPIRGTKIFSSNSLLQVFFVKSVRPKKLTTAWTRLENSGLPPLPSRPSFLSVTPSRQERWAPAEGPIAPIRSGLMWYLRALARSQRTAALQSSIWAGKRAVGTRR